MDESACGFCAHEALSDLHKRGEKCLWLKGLAEYKDIIRRQT